MNSSVPTENRELPPLLNRELSWLDYASRVLELASDPDQPLLERVKLCGIFSSNLDEFYMVRVAGLLDQVAAGLVARGADGMTAQETLGEIRRGVADLSDRQAKLWLNELQPALAEHGILVAGIDELTEAELEELEGHYGRHIYPVLTPLAVGPGQRFPYISGLSLSLGITVRDPETGEERFARVKVPEGLPRFQPVGARGVLVPMEDVIAHFLPWLFPGMEFAEQVVFRVTRDSDFEVSDEADDLLEAVRSELRRRRFGDVVRLEVSSGVSGRMLERLEDRLGIGSEQVYRQRGMLDLADLQQLAGLERPELKYEPWLPVTQPRLASPVEGDLFAEIRRGDMLVQHPYDSFATSVEQFVALGAADPSSVALKTTIYRTSGDSALAPALIDAAEAGKQSVCLVELKARFDERRNIEWSRRLEQAGVHVVYGFPDLKIHAKTTLVVRREAAGLQRYVHIGTGNYHPVTARLYEDVGVFTADPEIAADVADLFNFVTGFGRPQKFRRLLVAPINLRTGLLARIKRGGRSGRGRSPGARPDQGEQPERPGRDQGARTRVPGGRSGRPRDPLRLHPEAGHPRSHRQHQRAQRARPLPRAQPPLPLPGRRGARLPDRERRPDAAEPRPPDRGARPDRRQPAPGRAGRDPRDAAQGQHHRLGDAAGRNVAAPVAAKERAAAADAGQRHAPAQAARHAPRQGGPEVRRPTRRGE